jgi:hypothetical protein
MPDRDILELIDNAISHAFVDEMRWSPTSREPVQSPLVPPTVGTEVRVGEGRLFWGRPGLTANDFRGWVEVGRTAMPVILDREGLPEISFGFQWPGMTVAQASRAAQDLARLDALIPVDQRERVHAELEQQASASAESLVVVIHRLWDALCAGLTTITDAFGPADTVPPEPLVDPIARARAARSNHGPARRQRAPRSIPPRRSR